MRMIFLLGIFVFLFGFVSAGWSDDLGEGLVSYYGFEGSFEDSVGGNDGVNYGADFVGGKVGEGANFDFGDYVVVGDDDSLDLDEFSFSLWFKAGAQHEGYLINKGNNVESEQDIAYRLYVTEPHVTGDD